MSAFLSATGLVAFVFLSGRALLGEHLAPGTDLPSRQQLHYADTVLQFLAVGDINLGRTVGQKILGGDTLYPFALVRDALSGYDIVFGNLECQLSNQQGETQHPANNLIFTGPPAGAQSLRMGGIGVVSTANNHAMDYGLRAHAETISNLAQAGVLYAGTSGTEDSLYEPTWILSKGMRVALLACTDVMNIEDPMWKKYVASADSGKLFPAIRKARRSADFLVVSYHGGNEYSDHPSEFTKELAYGSLAAGADLFLGHHPHVPQRIEQLGEKIIVYSLGNFVFNQPFNYWTQRSFTFEATVQKKHASSKITRFRCIPLMAGDQPRMVGGLPEGDEILEHVSTLSGSEFAWHD